MISNRCPRASFGPFTYESAGSWRTRSRPRKPGSTSDCDSLARMCSSATSTAVVHGVRIPKWFRSSGIPSSRPRPGPVAGNSHAGSPHKSGPEKNSTISELNRLFGLAGKRARIRRRGECHGTLTESPSNVFAVAERDLMVQQSLAAAKFARRNIFTCETITLYLPPTFCT